MLRRHFLPLVPVAALAALPAGLFAQTFLSFWNNSIGPWSDGLRWSTSPVFPNGPNYGAVINGGTVTLDGDYSVQFFGIGAGQLIGTGNRTLTNNAGFILLGAIGNGLPANTVTVVSNGGISLLSGFENGTPGTPSNVTINAATLINAAGSTASQTSQDNPISLGNGALVRNDGTWLARSDNGLRNVGGPLSTFRNTGLFRRDVGTGAYVVGINGGIQFVNDGVFELQSGTMRFNAGGSASGPFTLAAGTRLEVGDYIFNAGASVGGAGELRLGSGTRVLNASLTFSVGLLRQDVGSILVAQGQTLETTGALQLLGGQLGNGLAVNAGTLHASGGATLGGGGYTINNATLRVPTGATAVQSNASDFLRLGSGGQLVIDGTFRAQTDNGIINNGGGGVGIVNNGVFVRDNSSGVYRSSINASIPFLNAGSVQVRTGTLLFANTGSSSGNFDVASGTSLVVDASYTFAAGTTITGGGLFTWQSGVQSFPSSLTLTVAQARQSGGQLLVAQGTTLALEGAFEWQGGQLGSGQAADSGTLRANGGVTFGPGGGQTVNNATLHIPTDASAWQTNANDFVRLGTSGQIRNDGTYYARVDNGIVNNGGGGLAFFNHGTFVRDTAGGTFAIGINGGIPFQNFGSTQVQTGTLELRAGGVSTGNFSIASGAVLSLIADYTFDAGTTVTGGGRVVWSGSNQFFPTSLTFSVTQPRLTSGAFLIGQGQTLTLAGAFEWLGGNLGNGQSQYAGTLRANGGLTFGPGGGQTVNNATLHIPAGASAFQLNANDFVRLGTNGQIRNDGTYYARVDNGMVNNGGGGIAFLNQGLFVRDVGTGVYSTAINGGPPFLNAGTTRAASGTLRVSGGGSSTGAFEVLSGAVLEFNADYLFDLGTSVSGAGLLAFTSSTHRFPNLLTLQVAQVQQSGATFLLAQGATLTLNGAFNWLGGGALGNGQVESSGTLRAAGGFTLGPNGGQLLNSATLHLPAGAVGIQVNTNDFLRLGNGAQLRLDGTYYARSDNGILNNGGAPSTILNTGTFVRDVGSGVFDTAVNGGPTFTNAGSVQVQSGTLRLGGGGSATGSFSAAAGTVLEFSNSYSFSGSTTATGAGTLRLSGGTLSIPSSLALGIASVAQANGNVSIAVGQTLALTGQHVWTNGLVQGGGTLLAGGGASFAGAQNLVATTYSVPAGATVTVQPGSGLFALSNGARLANAGTVLARNGGGGLLQTGGGGTFSNTGLFQGDTGGGVFLLFNGLTFDNLGTTAAVTGTLRLDTAIAQFSAGTLTGGTWQVADGATLDGSGFAGGILSNAASIRLTGAGALFPPLAALAANSGTLRLDARNFTTAGPFANSGRIELANGSVFTVPSGAQLTNTTTGVLTGQGTIASRLLNTGTVEARGAGTTLVLTGEVTNNGLFVAAAGGTINAVNTTFVNNGVLDRSTGTILLPAGYIDNGVTVDSSKVRIRSAVKTGNTVTLAVDGFSGHSYQLQRSLDLAGDVFVNLGAPQAGTTGGQLIFTDGNASGARGFYRVVVD